MSSDHLAQPEDDHPVVLWESDHTPPVAHGEGEAEQEVGGRRDEPHQDPGAQGDGAPGLIWHVLEIENVMRSYFAQLFTALDQIEKFSFVEKIVNFQLFNLFTLDNTFK